MSGINNYSFSDLDKMLANYLLTLEEGEQLLGTREMAERFDASLGSISAAVNRLEKYGAVTINRRGRLGAFLEHKSIPKLWSVAEKGPMVISLTLPSFRKCEGLATAIHSLLNNAGIETYLTFIRGSINRINALRAGLCHAVVLSELAAEELCNADEEIVLRLPPESFTGEHRVFYRDTHQATSQPWKVAIDPESFDIRYLTELEFGDSDVEFEQVPFSQIDLHLEDSPVDAAITTNDFLERLASSGIASRPLSPHVREVVGERTTSAAFVINSNSSATRIVLKEILEPEKVLEIQQGVEAKLIVPKY
jgi:hypothetical protein